VVGDFNGSFKRVDIAIDDFTANDIDIYDLQDFAEKGHWTGSFQSLKIINDISFRGGIRSKGYSLTFGSPGSNQLQIYDKNLERFSKRKESLDTKVWYRYETRLVNDRANNAIREYMRAFAYDTSGISSFLEFGSSLLGELIMFKKEPLGNDTQIEKTIDIKKKWYKRSIASTNAEIYLSNEEEFLTYMYSILNTGVKKIDSKKLNIINKKRIENRLEILNVSDIKNLSI
jgi:DNA relaxase NicK